MERTQTAIYWQGARLVGKEQVRRLILAARAAHRRQYALGLTDEPFDAWRGLALADAVPGVTSFRAVTQGSYADALAHFRRMAGGVAAVEPGYKDKERRARWRLSKTLSELADSFGGADGARAYAERLFTSIHKTSSRDANASQIWNVIFTLRNRAKRKGIGV